MTQREYWLMSRAYYGALDQAVGFDEHSGAWKSNCLRFDQWLNELEGGKTIEERIAEDAPQDDRLQVMREYMPETAWWNLVRDYPEWELELDK